MMYAIEATNHIRAERFRIDLLAARAMRNVEMGRMTRDFRMSFDELYG